jgi:hypothetical protein
LDTHWGAILPRFLRCVIEKIRRGVGLAAATSDCGAFLSSRRCLQGLRRGECCHDRCDRSCIIPTIRRGPALHVATYRYISTVLGHLEDLRSSTPCIFHDTRPYFDNLPRILMDSHVGPGLRHAEERQLRLLEGRHLGLVPQDAPIAAHDDPGGMILAQRDFTGCSARESRNDEDRTAPRSSVYRVQPQPQS